MDRNIFKVRSVDSFSVALLAEGVDRNCPMASTRHRKLVALLAEGVDRNTFTSEGYAPGAWRVALLAEGVDRNKSFSIFVMELPWSPSSRRAWIEIACGYGC